MARTEPYLGRYLSKFLLAVLPGLAASALAVFVLYMVHLSRMPEPVDRLTDDAVAPAAMSDGLSSEERRELTRQMLKARRENPEIPAEVKPTQRAAAVQPAVDGGDGAADTKARPERAVSATATPLPPRPARPQPVVQPTVASATPAAAPVPLPAPAPAPAPAPIATAAVTPPGGAVPSAVPNAAATTLSPVVVSTPPAAAEPQPERRGFAANVFSSISVFAGTAANATGNTVNWVIDLPGRAISAGGRLLVRDPAPAQPATPPADPAPPKRNYL